MRRLVTLSVDAIWLACSAMRLGRGGQDCVLGRFLSGSMLPTFGLLDMIAVDILGTVSCLSISRACRARGNQTDNGTISYKCFDLGYNE